MLEYYDLKGWQTKPKCLSPDERGLRKGRVSVSDSDPDPDPDPCGSILKWLSWIRIWIRIGNTDPDPGQSKWCPKRGKSL